MSEQIRPIDHDRAARIALALLDGEDARANTALLEANSEGTVHLLIAALVQTWMNTSIHFVGRKKTRLALEGAILDIRDDGDENPAG